MLYRYYVMLVSIKAEYPSILLASGSTITEAHTNAIDPYVYLHELLKGRDNCVSQLVYMTILIIKPTIDFLEILIPEEAPSCPYDHNHSDCHHQQAVTLGKPRPAFLSPLPNIRYYIHHRKYVRLICPVPHLYFSCT